MITLLNEDLLVEAVEWASLRMSGLMGLRGRPAVDVQFEPSPGGPAQPVFRVLDEAVSRMGQKGALTIVRQVWTDTKVELAARVDGNRMRRYGSAKEKAGTPG